MAYRSETKQTTAGLPKTPPESPATALGRLLQIENRRPKLSEASSPELELTNRSGKTNLILANNPLLSLPQMLNRAA